DAGPANLATSTLAVPGTNSRKSTSDPDFLDVSASVSGSGSHRSQRGSRSPSRSRSRSPHPPHQDSSSQGRVHDPTPTPTQSKTNLQANRRPTFKMTPYGLDGDLRRSAFVPFAFEDPPASRRAQVQVSVHANGGRKIRNTMNRLSGLMAVCAGTSGDSEWKDDDGAGVGSGSEPRRKGNEERR
ncbi:hypothetical protein C8F01DRAFT_1138984, partial [Mycena amicta]